MQPLAAGDTGAGHQQLPLLPLFDGESGAEFPGPHIFDECRGQDVRMRIDNHDCHLCGIGFVRRLSQGLADVNRADPRARLLAVGAIRIGSGSNPPASAFPRLA